MKTTKALAFFLAAIAAIAVFQPARSPAQTTVRTGICNFNQRLVMECTITDASSGFSITWKDGVSDRYEWVGANADQFNIRDARRGRWHLSDQRNCRDFDLTNLDNGNVITFTGSGEAC